MVDRLTGRQRFWFEHLERARASGETLKAYAQAQGISLSRLYNASSRLTRSDLPKDKASSGKKLSRAAFVPVRLSATAPRTWRLRHPSGWVLESEGMPDPQWLRDLCERGAV